MFQIETSSPYQHATTVENEPIRFMVHPAQQATDLGAIKIGKFFSRLFDTKAWVKKAPRTIAGAATGYMMGGGWSGAAAGGLTAAAFRRRKGTSLFQDIYRGGLYGMIGGTAVGVGKELIARPYFNYKGPSGFAGYATRNIKNYILGPKATTQYTRPIGPQPRRRPLPKPNPPTTGHQVKSVPQGKSVRQQPYVPSDIKDVSWTKYRLPGEEAWTDVKEASWWEKASDFVKSDSFTNFFAPVTMALLGQSVQGTSNGMASEGAQQQAVIGSGMMQGYPAGAGVFLPGVPGYPGGPIYPGPGGVPGDIGEWIEGGYAGGNGSFGGSGFPTDDWLPTDEAEQLQVQDARRAATMAQFKRIAPYAAAGAVGLGIIYAFWPKAA